MVLRVRSPSEKVRQPKCTAFWLSHGPSSCMALSQSKHEFYLSEASFKARWCVYSLRYFYFFVLYRFYFSPLNISSLLFSFMNLVIFLYVSMRIALGFSLPFVGQHWSLFPFWRELNRWLCLTRGAYPLCLQFISGYLSVWLIYKC